MSPHILEFFQRNWEVTEEDKKLLGEYRKSRKVFGWAAISELLAWSYAKFPHHKEYSPLFSIISHFEFREDLSGNSLQCNISAILEELNFGIAYMRKMMVDSHLEERLIKIQELFDSESPDSPIPVYVLYSYEEGSSSGNADGNSIYVEIPKGGEFERAYQILVHEYAHKIIHPNSYFRESSSALVRDLSRKVYPHVYKDELYGFFEEAVIYALCEILFFSHDPDQKIQNLKRSSSLSDVAKGRYAHIWRLSKNLTSLFDLYLRGIKSADVTIKDLERTLVNYIGGV
ncbi:hypothetical protein GF360_02575 [candidate division WWE3 bacterium]|nr:hypothetical protein [candidate division WWE3 bacterium]